MSAAAFDSDRQAEIMRLHDGENLSFEQIGIRFGISRQSAWRSYKAGRPRAVLTPAQRAGAVDAAKNVAVRYRWAVARSDAALIQQIWDELGRLGDLADAARAALPVILAEAITDGNKLLIVTKTADGGQIRAVA
jgi:hypothetical protein